MLREFSWCKEYGIESLDIRINETHKTVTIYNSYKIKKYKHMKEVIETIQLYHEFNKPVWLQIAEWRSHNLLYFLNFQRDRTQHVDLDYNQDWKLKVGYTVLSLFYFNF